MRRKGRTGRNSGGQVGRQSTVDSRQPGRVALGLLAVLAMGLGACRGQPSAEPPIHPIPDMRVQPKVRPQGASLVFADGKGMRPPVAGTVAQGQLKADEAFYTGKTAQGFVAKAPIEVTEATLKRGQERFNIFCSSCHDRAGSGRGMTVQRGFPPPVDLTGERVRSFADGQIFDVATHGVRNMPGYAAQVPEDDRWAIVTWIRVLQKSQHATPADVPPDRQDKIEPEAK